MKIKLFLAFLFLLLSSYSVLAATCGSNSRTRTSIYFSPRGGATQAIVTEINSAKKEVLVLAYSFTSDPITYALLNAKSRGVNVEVVMDDTQLTSRGSAYTDLKEVTKIDSFHSGLQHNKVIIIDDTTLITGSFNFSNNAEYNNGENLMVIKKNSCIIKEYKKDFIKHKEHSK